MPTTPLVETHEKLSTKYETDHDLLNSGFLNESFFDLQGMMIPDFTQDNRNYKTFESCNQEQCAASGDHKGTTGQNNQRKVDLGSVSTIMANLDAKFARKSTKYTDKTRIDRAK
jgi:hypothetical protein